MKIELANRLKNLPPYLFAEIDCQKQALKQKGIEILDFGVGDPDLPTPDFIIEALKEGFTLKNYHQYPSYSGSETFKEIAIEWFQNRFGVELDPKKEIIALIGSKEGIAHTPLSLINPGEKVLYTSPGYPVYKIATEFADGIPIEVPLTLENEFLPDLSKLPTDAKLFFFNYPNNPTSATASFEFFKELVEWAKKHEVILCHDAAYSEIYFDGNPTRSILEVPGAKDIAIEFHSLSKTFNMTGWRIGFAVGNENLISALGKMKTNIDSGQFLPIQHAACAALKEGESFIEHQRQVFQKRRDLLTQGLTKAGLEVYPCKSTFYLWTKTPQHKTSIEFSQSLLQNFGIVSTPGIGFGTPGEGYIRFSLTVSEPTLHKAVQKLIKFQK